MVFPWFFTQYPKMPIALSKVFWRDTTVWRACSSFMTTSIREQMLSGTLKNRKTSRGCPIFYPPREGFMTCGLFGSSTESRYCADPIDRFFSAYNNRVLWHEDLEFRGLSVGEVICELERGNFENKHFLPQTYFLGTSPSYYTHLAVMPDLTPALSGIQEFFGKDIALPRLQVRHGESKAQVESHENFKSRLMKVYAADYEFIQRASSRSEESERA